MVICATNTKGVDNGDCSSVVCSFYFLISYFLNFAVSITKKQKQKSFLSDLMLRVDCSSVLVSVCLIDCF